MIVRVTARSIRDAEYSKSGCPVAVSLRKATGQPWTVREEEAECLSSGDVVDLPAVATRFIRDFDAEMPVHPFEFEFAWEPEAANA